MKKYNSIFLILLSIFFFVSCIGKQIPDTRVEEEINTFVSKTHGTVAIFPSYEYLGNYESYVGKGIRKYFLWENKRQSKYVMIMQLVPKEGTFPENLIWVPSQGSLYIKGFTAAYTSIAEHSYNAMIELGAKLPTCFILAEEIHVNPKEALFRILIVPDKMCAEDYEPVMEELNRVAIIKPLG